MPVPDGVEHREAPEASTECSRNPMGAAGLQQIRELPSRPNTLGRRSEAWRLACNSAVRDVEDSSVRGDERGRRPLRRLGSDVLRRGFAGSGTMAMEPGRRGLERQRAPGAFDLVFLRARGCIAPGTSGRGRLRDAAMRRGDAARRPKERRGRKPHERQRTQRVRKARGRSTRRGGEKPRGRTVPGREARGARSLCRRR